jgi:hypothetical protein
MLLLSEHEYEFILKKYNKKLDKINFYYIEISSRL